ncbi:hypothetical protein DBR42_03930 [Pelomonas sp. HMWF004]|nr:hypothetical protein DBR42_03930 [Pelomonas sp. HMWF004]
MSGPPPLQPPRPEASASVRYVFGAHSINPSTRELRRGGQLVATTPKVFDLLLVLLEQRNRVVPHDELLERIWARSHVSAGVLPQMVRKLRLALETPGQRVAWIKGVRGVGYRFVGRVEVVAGATVSAAVAAEPATTEAHSSAAADRRLYELGRAQIRLDDLPGLAHTVTQLRSPAAGGGTRHSLIWAELFESHLERLRANGKTAWHHLRTAQLMMEGLDDPHLRSEFHSVRGLYFESFTSEAEALTEFETAWALAQQSGDLRTMAGCAARLAFAFAHSHNAPAFEQWTARSLQLAAECGPRSTYLRHLVAAAMGWKTLASHLARRGERTEARQAWAKALRLNEAVLNEGEGGDVSARTRRIAWINWLDVQARLDEHCREASLQGLQACLADETRPSGRAQLLQLLARHLCERGDAPALQAATEHINQALGVCEEFSLTDQRDGLLEQAADVATAQGDHLAANRLLRDLLRWRSEQAARQAERVAAITAVRLDTERMLALAESEREKSRLLSLENQVLRQRTAQLERLSEPDAVTGLATPAQWERQLAAAWAEASSRHLPLCLALLALDAQPDDRGADGAVLREVAQHLQQACRDGDVVARLHEPGRFAILFHGVGLAPAQAVCERIRVRLDRPLPPRSLSIGLADVAPLAEVTHAMGHVGLALAQALASGGNRLVVLSADVIKK